MTKPFQLQYTPSTVSSFCKSSVFEEERRLVFIVFKPDGIPHFKLLIITP